MTRRRDATTSPKPGPVPKAKNDDSVQARPLKMSRFHPPEPGPVPKCKNDDSLQAGPFKKNRFGPLAQLLPAQARLLPVPMTRRRPDDALVSNPNDTAPPRRRAGQESQSQGAAQTTRWSAIPMTRRRPDDGLVSNLNDTAPRRRRPGQQSQ